MIGRWQGLSHEDTKIMLEHMAVKHEIAIKTTLDELHKLKEKLAHERRELARVRRRASAHQITLETKDLVP